MRTVRYILPCSYRSETFSYLHKETILADYPIILPSNTQFYHPYGGSYFVINYDSQSLTIECERDKATAYLDSKQINTFSFSPEFLKHLHAHGLLYNLQDKSGDDAETLDNFIIPILLSVGTEFYSYTGLYKVAYYKATSVTKGGIVNRFEFTNWKPEYGICTLWPICICIKTREELEQENPQSPYLKLTNYYNGGFSYTGHQLTEWEKNLLRERIR